MKPDERFKLSRHSVPAGLALTVTVSLELLMQHLIEADGDGLNEAARGHVVTFERVIEDVPPIPEPTKAEMPPPPVAPPDTRVPPLVDYDGGDWGRVTRSQTCRRRSARRIRGA